ncbi:hypothetical protein QTP88_012674 [Uroleucon formosanum]
MDQRPPSPFVESSTRFVYPSEKNNTTDTRASPVDNNECASGSRSSESDFRVSGQAPRRERETFRSAASRTRTANNTAACQRATKAQRSRCVALATPIADLLAVRSRKLENDRCTAMDRTK